MRQDSNHPNANWGGARAGAGRPREEKTLEKKITVRVSQALYELYKREGNSDELREAVRITLMKRSAAKEKCPGFDALSANDFMTAAIEHGRLINSSTVMSAQCGFPSPALDYSKEEISIYDLVVHHEDATILVRAAGDSMMDAGIFEDDILVVDRALEARPGDIVLAYLHGEFTIKRLRIVDGKPELHPENREANYPVIHPTPYDDFAIEGVVTNAIRNFRK